MFLFLFSSYVQLWQLFGDNADSSASPLSLHCLVGLGAGLGRRAGDWWVVYVVFVWLFFVVDLGIINGLIDCIHGLNLATDAFSITSMVWKLNRVDGIHLEYKVVHWKTSVNNIKSVQNIGLIPSKGSFCPCLKVKQLQREGGRLVSNITTERKTVTFKKPKHKRKSFQSQEHISIYSVLLCKILIFCWITWPHGSVWIILFEPSLPFWKPSSC